MEDNCNTVGKKEAAAHIDLGATESLRASQEKFKSLFCKCFDLKSVLSIYVTLFTGLRSK